MGGLHQKRTLADAGRGRYQADAPRETTGRAEIHGGRRSPARVYPGNLAPGGGVHRAQVLAGNQDSTRRMVHHLLGDRTDQPPAHQLASAMPHDNELGTPLLGRQDDMLGRMPDGDF